MDGGWNEGRQRLGVWRSSTGLAPGPSKRTPSFPSHRHLGQAAPGRRRSPLNSTAPTWHPPCSCRGSSGLPRRLSGSRSSPRPPRPAPLPPSPGQRLAFGGGLVYALRDASRLGGLFALTCFRHSGQTRPLCSPQRTPWSSAHPQPALARTISVPQEQGRANL